MVAVHVSPVTKTMLPRSVDAVAQAGHLPGSLAQLNAIARSTRSRLEFPRDWPQESREWIRPNRAASHPLWDSAKTQSLVSHLARRFPGHGFHRHGAQSAR